MVATPDVCSLEKGLHHSQSPCCIEVVATLPFSLLALWQKNPCLVSDHSALQVLGCRVHQAQASCVLISAAAGLKQAPCAVADPWVCTAP